MKILLKLLAISYFTVQLSQMSLAEATKIEQAAKLVDFPVSITIKLPGAGGLNASEKGGNASDNEMRISFVNTATFDIKIRKIDVEKASLDVFLQTVGSGGPQIIRLTPLRIEVQSNYVNKVIREIDRNLNDPSAYVTLSPNESYVLSTDITQLRRDSVMRGDGQQLIFKFRFDKILLGSVDWSTADRFKAYINWVSTPMFMFKGDEWMHFSAQY